MADILAKLKRMDESVEIMQSVSTISNQQINLSSTRSGSLNMIFTCPSSSHALILSQSTMAFVFSVQTQAKGAGRENIRFQPNFLGNLINSFTLSVNNMESSNISKISDNSNISMLLNFNNTINLRQSEFNLISSVSDCNFISLAGQKTVIEDQTFTNASIIKNPGKVIPYVANSDQQIIILLNISNICSLANSLNLIPGMISFNITFTMTPDQVFQPIDMNTYPINPDDLIPQNTQLILTNVDLYASIAKFSSSIPAGISFRGLSALSAALPNNVSIICQANSFSSGQTFFSNNIQLAPNKLQYMVFVPYISDLGNPPTTPTYNFYNLYSPSYTTGDEEIVREVPYKPARNGFGLDDSVNISQPRLIFGGNQILNSNNLMKYNQGPYQSIDNFLFSFIHGQSFANDGSTSRSCFPYHLYNQNKFIVFDCSKIDFSSYQNQVGFSCFIQPPYKNIAPGTVNIRFLYFIFSEKIYN